MPLSGDIYIGLCFSDPLDAARLSEKLGEVAPKIHFVFGESFDDFLRAIAQRPRIDCFIIEEKFKECPSIDLIEKLKKSQRYKKSAIVLSSPKKSLLDKKYLELGIDYIFDQSTPIDEFITSIKKVMTKKLTPVIPANYNVMVLDNSTEILDVISTHLGELGHAHFDLCKGVKEAKINLIDKEYDLLLLDWNLDDGTCIDLIEFIKSSSISPRTKSALTVVITGRDDVDDIMTLLRYGVKDHIIKPFDFHEFEDKIGYAIDKHIKRL